MRRGTFRRCTWTGGGTSMAAILRFHKMPADQDVQGARYHFREATKLEAEHGGVGVVCVRRVCYWHYS